MEHIYEAENPTNRVPNYVGVKVKTGFGNIEVIHQVEDILYFDKASFQHIDIFKSFLADGSWVIVPEEPLPVHKCIEVDEELEICEFCGGDGIYVDGDNNTSKCTMCNEEPFIRRKSIKVESEILPKESSDISPTNEITKRNEAAKNYAKEIGNIDGTAVFDFLKGATWQKEQLQPIIEKQKKEIDFLNALNSEGWGKVQYSKRKQINYNLNYNL